MNLVKSATAPTLKAACIGYLAEGLSVIPLVGKKSTIRWVQFQQICATVAEVEEWDKAGKLKNVGIICGDVSAGLVVIDTDGTNATLAFEAQFPNLLDTFTVITGSGTGKHFYYQCDRPSETTRALRVHNGNIEFRANGCYVVAPPSQNPETLRHYRIERALPVKHLDNDESVRTWLLRLNPSESAAVPQKQKARTIKVSDTDARRKALAALGYELNSIRYAMPDNRNNALNRAAYNLGQLVGDCLLSRWEVEQELLAAYQRAKQGSSEGKEFIEREGRNTIKSGIEAGIRNPRSRRHA